MRFFYMLSLLVYFEYLDSRRWCFLCLSIVFGILSVLSKPMALSLPIVLLVCDFFYSGKINRRDLFNKAYFAAFIVPITWVSFLGNSVMMHSYSWSGILVWVWCFNFYLSI